jgi:hypothetical protein
MKKITCLFLFLIVITANAQRPNITVASGSETVDKVQRAGLKTFVSFDKKKVADAWEEYLRKNAKCKTESSKGVITAEKATIPAISNMPIRIISKVDDNGKNEAFVFAAFDVGSGYVTSGDSRYAAAERFMRDFVVKMYRDEYGDQLGNAEKAYLAAQKTQEKLAEKEKDWQKEVVDSNKDIADMQKKIEEKKQKIAELNKQIEDNKINKQKAADETEKTKKAYEQMKAKLGEIN